ncbi:hypothetical protein [Novosphingobium sp.]|uniref:hypothetical protein n=1 Tax=Novosphingobium sp. TaxID=1874826 RepID=UPI0038BA2635
MAKVLRIIGMVAAGVALVATGIGAFGGASLAASLGTTTAALTQIATIASVVSSVAMIGSQLLAKPPPARGAVTQTVIAVEPPRPYVMGEGHCGGVRRYDRAYGGKIKKIQNPYNFIVDVYSGVGPVESIAPRFDYAPIPSYFATFAYTSQQLGACPESAALVPYWSGAPNWSTASKLSGCAAIGWNFRFDKDGKRFAAGVPVMGAYGKWVKVYDPRKDSTFPGGSGSHRLGVEPTYEWSENPALHFGMYAYGRYQNGKKVMGVGLPSQSIDWIKIAAWANVCQANAWTMFGRVFEPGDRWANLRDIAIAGGAEPAFSGAVLTVRYQAPQVSLATITEADLAAGDVSVPGMRPYAERVNTAIPRYIDPDSNWELMAARPIVFSGLVAADGEEKKQEWPFNFVKKVNQAAQLAAYRVLDSREQTPIELPLLPQWRTARPGECYTCDLPNYGLTGDVIVLARSIDPETLTVKLTVQTETAGKHATALATTGTPPDAVVAGQTAQDRDDVADGVLLPGDDIVYDGGLVIP